MIVALLALAFEIAWSGEFSMSDLKDRASPLHSVLGTGLRVHSQGVSPSHCLKSFKTLSLGRQYEWNFQTLGETFKSDHLELNRFVEAHLANSKKVNFSGLNYFPFLVTVEIEQPGESVDDGALTLSDDLSSVPLKKFFESCGTTWISSVRKSDRIAIFMAYYGQTDQQVKRLEETIRQRLREDPYDSHQIKVFKDLDFDKNTYFAMQTLGSSASVPFHFGFKEWTGKEIDDVVEQALTRFLNAAEGASGGEVSRVVSQDWLNLPVFQNLVSSECSEENDSGFSRRGYCKRGAFEQMRYLRDRLVPMVRQLRQLEEFQKTPAGAQNPAVKGCLIRHRTLLTETPWDIFNLCSKEFLNSSERYTQRIPSCSNLEDRLLRLEALTGCELPELRALPSSTLFHSKTYRPARVGAGVAARTGIELGTGRFMAPQPTPKNRQCLMADSNNLTPVGRQSKTTYSFLPVERVSVPGRPPVHGVYFRANFEIRGLSDSLGVRGQVNSGAQEILKQKGLPSFFEECGTHFIAQFSHRRGVEVHAWIKDADLFRASSWAPAGHDFSDWLREALDPRSQVGVSNSPTARFMPLDAPVSFTEIEIKPYGLSEAQAAHPVFQVKVLRDYLNRKAEMVQILDQDDSAAVPTELYLEPFSDILFWRDLLGDDGLL